jgi:hypothetical protein
MRIDSSGNVGIGTTPTYQFDVFTTGNNGIRTNNGTDQIILGDTAAVASVGTITNTAFQVISNGSSAIYVDNSQNVLIGATSQYASEKLGVNGDVYVNGEIRANSLWLSGGGDVTLEAAAGIGYGVGGAAEASIRVFNSYLQFKTSNTEAMRIDSSGNVGLGGTPVDSQGFGLALDLLSGGTFGSAIYLRKASDITKYGFLAYDYSQDKTTLTSFGASNILTFNVGTGSNERMRIDSSGNVLIGATSQYGTETLGVAGSIASAGSLELGYGASTGDVKAELGSGRTGSGLSYVDLIGDTTYTDYGLRIVRNGGANANSAIVHRGTGELQISANDAGAIEFNTNGSQRLYIASDGGITMSNLPTSDPSVAGELWNNSGVVNISAG